VRRRKGRVAALLVLSTMTAVTIFAFGGGAATATDLHPLTVTSTTSIACTWSIQKTAPSHLTLAVGEGFDIPYTVAVTKSCTGDVTGTVSGPGNPNTVAVTLGDGTQASVSCTYDSQATSFTCTYDAHPASLSDGTVSATATYNDGSTKSGSTAYSFNGVTPSENSVGVLDTNLSSPLAIHLDHSATFNYTIHVSFPTCGSHTVDNTAIVKDDTILGTSTATVTINVPCVAGCTLTQGYWKTHSKYGPAPSDPAWNNIAPAGPDTIFFLSGQTWYQVFNTPPSGGNAYYILAVQYMAAELNILNGASSTAAVNAALSWATGFFSTYTPAQIGALDKSSPLRATALSAASTLDSYNSGVTGPGHCDS
jgi:hypothetical protein